MNIPTAEETLKIWQDKYKTSKPVIYESLIDVMKEFAKLHVETALKEASEQAYAFTSFDDKPLVSKLSILNSYPLTNIE
jgi:Holliday junction resolvasome RuvABC DNA-binding subunit